MSKWTLLLGVVVCVCFIVRTSSVRIDYPPALRNAFAFSPASFGLPYFTHEKVIAPLKVGFPLTGCTPLSSSYGSQLPEAFYGNSVVLVYRGGCTFVTKALTAQAVGAVGVIIVDETSVSSDDLFILSDDGFGWNVTIPVAMVTRRDGYLLRESLRAGFSVRVSLNEGMEYNYYY
eukprot:PhF_6_TR32537/c0_g1_i1/m.48174